MTFYVTNRMGEMFTNPPRSVVTQVLTELDQIDDPEHPDVALAHESGWTLSAFPEGLLIWENVESDNEPEHMAGASRAKTEELWLALAAGDLATVEREPWQPGYGSSLAASRPEASIHQLTDPHNRRLSTMSDDEIIAELASLEPLPHETDPRWHEPPFELFQHAGQLVALAGQIGERTLVQGIGLVLDKACLGDPGEMMRVLRHPLEAACRGDWDRLTKICAERSTSPRAGTRLWATSELALLRDSRVVEAIRARLEDVEPLVQEEAVRAAVGIALSHPDAALELRSDLAALAESASHSPVREAALSAMELINEADGR